MRTTLTLDDDVAALLARARKTRRASFKQIVNAALREGLQVVEPPRRRRPGFRTQPISLGRCLVGNLDNVAEVLALVEGEAFR
jgi:hypothetical protein